MAAGPTTLPPPPGAGDTSGSPDASTAPAQASPAPPTTSPAMQQGTQLAISVVGNLRAIAKAFPSTSPKIAEINNLMRDVMSLMMVDNEPGQPAAPPSGGQ